MFVVHCKLFSETGIHSGHKNIELALDIAKELSSDFDDLAEVIYITENEFETKIVKSFYKGKPSIGRETLEVW